MKRILLLIFFMFPVAVYSAEYRLALASGITNDVNVEIMGEMVKEIFERAGHSAVIVRLPSERGIIEADQGTLDGDAFRYKGVEKRSRNLILVDEPVGMAIVIGYVMDEKLRNITLNDLGKYSVIYRRGFRIVETELLPYLDKNRIVIATEKDSGIKMLIFGRGDVLLVPGYLDQYRNYYQKEFNIKVYQTRKPLFISTSHILINKKNKNIIPSLNRAIRDMKADGSINKYTIRLKE